MSPYPRFEQVASSLVELICDFREEAQCLLDGQIRRWNRSMQVLRRTVCLQLVVSPALPRLSVGTCNTSRLSSIEELLVILQWYPHPYRDRQGICWIAGLLEVVEEELGQNQKDRLLPNRLLDTPTVGQEEVW
ncbi:hypothetical protein Tco_0295097 [Tanacetum coccineum]